MGGLKQMELEKEGQREQAWQFVAEKKGFRCKICGEMPPFEEREVYFETKMCGFHAYQMRKDD